MKSTELEESSELTSDGLVLQEGKRYVWDTEPAHDNVVAHCFDRSKGFFW